MILPLYDVLVQCHHCNICCHDVMRAWISELHPFSTSNYNVTNTMYVCCNKGRGKGRYFLAVTYSQCAKGWDVLAVRFRLWSLTETEASKRWSRLDTTGVKPVPVVCVARSHRAPGSVGPKYVLFNSSIFWWLLGLGFVQCDDNRRYIGFTTMVISTISLLH